ncbi:hypothetical protein BH09ACT6_BH09ACT6_16070 [soil metagenome]
MAVTAEAASCLGGCELGAAEARPSLGCALASAYEVTVVTIRDVGHEATKNAFAAGDWIVLVVKIPSTPSRHRVAVWRELRRIGAVAVGQGVWAVPNTPSCAVAVARVTDLATHGNGDVLVLESRGQSDADAQKLQALFIAARNDEWSEFIAECGKFVAEIAREIAKDKLTMAELEEEQQSLDRLRRWHRDLKKRDVFGVPSGQTALTRLRGCNDRLDEYADLVYNRVQQG